MKFSVVIPTLRRSDTLRHALSTAAAQNYDQLEIIVQNNGNDLATQLVVHEFNDSRVKLFYTDVVLPMTNNWESAIRHCSGDYITFLGDDDALLDNACSMAAEILDESNIDLLSWAPFAYYWPSYVHASQLSNHLLGYIPSEKKVRTLDSKKMLRRFYKFEVHYSRLPMIYNSFVSRSIVSKITHEVGRYFIGLLPDVASGITNAIYSDRYLRLNFPLSISGTSHHSTGHNMLMSARGTDREDDIRRDFGEYRLDPRLPSNHHVDLAVANDMLAIKDNLLKDDSTTELDFAGLVKRLVENINDRPDFYEETLAAV